MHPVRLQPDEPLVMQQAASVILIRPVLIDMLEEFLEHVSIQPGALDKASYLSAVIRRFQEIVRQRLVAAFELGDQFEQRRLGLSE
jgi:hypothetical protein